MSFIVLIAACVMLVAAPANAGKIYWPNPNIPIPIEVRNYIVSECLEHRGWGEETVDECINGESYGYRAVVMMLVDEELGEKSAERYRGCAAGLGDLGGMFHRRKAECLSTVYCITWRFAYSERADMRITRKADLTGSSSAAERLKAMEVAMSTVLSDLAVVAD
jgi:hypothetical protein